MAAPPPRPDRRDWLARLAASALGASTASAWPRWAASQPAERLWGAQPFALGVASGSPSANGVVLWTRLLTPGLFGSSDLPAASVRWELAHDEAFRQIVQRGSALATPELGHSVHVPLQGLAPDRVYHYRFLLGEATSPVGRTRTLPTADALPQRLRLALASCQRWEHGHYAAWRHIVEQAPDLVAFVGDYIYEYASPRSGVQPLAATPIHRVHPLRRAQTLADYRDRYALHRSDPALQAAHAACPWLVTWDDHEVENDYAGLQGLAADPGAFLAQRAAAYQAFYENMPLPASVLVQGLAGLLQPEALRLYQRTDVGRLASFHVLDDRQYRAVQACRAPGRPNPGVQRSDECPELLDPARSLLGRAQEQWLDQGLARDARSGTRWSVLAQQTLFSARNHLASPRHPGGPGLYATDAWDGYPAARQRLLGALQQHQPRNTVLVGGDIHQHYVCDVKADYERPDSATVASEFCGTSISSHASTPQDKVDALVRRLPHVRYARSDQRGYVMAEITPARWTSTLWAVDDPGRPDSGLHTLARFVVEDGRPGPQRDL